MSISDGQRVRALESNAAWASKSADNTYLGQQTLNRTGSGSQITDVQQTINNILTDVTQIPGILTDVTNLQTLSGRPDGSSDLGTFTGATVPDNSNIKDAIQAIETEVESKIDLSEKGAANGVATLDAGGKIPSSQLPDGAFEFKGLWNASTNTPTLADGVGNPGDVYKVSVAGTQDLGSGSITFAIGEELYYNGAEWEKLGTNPNVDSVNGQTGSVVLDLNDINDVDITSVANRDELRYDSVSTSWKNYAPHEVQNDATAGSNVTLSSVNDNKLKRLTSGTLVSVDMIPAGYAQQVFFMINKTGNSVVINNDTGATAANRILTGSNSNLTLLNNQGATLIYDSVSSRWSIIGTTQIGGGVTNSNLFNASLSAAFSIADSTETKVQWSAIDLDPESGWDGTNFRYVFQNDAKVFFTIQLEYDAGTNGVRQVIVKKNGTTIAIHQNFPEGNNGALVCHTPITTKTFSFLATDYVEVFGYQTNTDTRNINSSVGTWFSIIKTE